MEKNLYGQYNDYHPQVIIQNGIQDVESLMQSIDNHSFSVPRIYGKINQTKEVLDADYY